MIKISQCGKRSEDSITLTLKKNPDILSELSNQKRQNQITIGFALETENENENALGKLQKKNLDCIVLNLQSNPEAGFGMDTNAVTVFCKDGKQWQIPTASKTPSKPLCNPHKPIKTPSKPLSDPHKPIKTHQNPYPIPKPDKCDSINAKKRRASSG